MSGDEGLWPAGLGVFDVDLARVAAAAARAEDRALQLLAQPGSATGGAVVKRVLPLHDELRPAVDLGGGYLDPATNNPRVLCLDAGYLGGTVGRVRLLPCAFQITLGSTPPAAQEITLLARQAAALDTTANFASSPLGRVDTVYAVVTWATPGDGVRDRRTKNPTTGVVSTVSTNVYRRPTVTLAIAVGTEGMATPGAVPADGADTWNVKLCEVALPVGYVAGAALSDLSGNFITQRWDRVGVRVPEVLSARPGQGMLFLNADAGQDTARVNASRGSDRHTVRAVFRHTAAALRVVLDAGIDWRHRLVRAALLRPAAQIVAAPYGIYPPPGRIAQGGSSNASDTGWVFSGYVGDVTVNGTAFWSVVGPPAMRLFANSVIPAGPADPPVGALVLEIDDAPTDVANGGDHYVAVCEALSKDEEMF